MENFEPAQSTTEIEANERAVSAKLRSLRVRACISLDEFAESLGIETAELASYEDGEHVPASVIAMACAISGVPFEYFFGDENIETPQGVLTNTKVTEDHNAFSN